MQDVIEPKEVIVKRDRAKRNTIGMRVMVTTRTETVGAHVRFELDPGNRFS